MKGAQLLVSPPEEIVKTQSSGEAAEAAKSNSSKIEDLDTSNKAAKKKRKLNKKNEDTATTSNEQSAASGLADASSEGMKMEPQISLKWGELALRTRSHRAVIVSVTKDCLMVE
ncbi:unnamed protein product, partial [Amoebophrya sp. A25]|eukprot:GSA25T00004283001.1